MVTTLIFACRSAAAALLLMAALACGAGNMELPAGAPTLEPLAAPEDVSTLVPVDLRTVQAQDMIRVREEHSALIAMIPTPTLPPTRPLSDVAAGYLLDGEPIIQENELVTDPELGVWWYRHSSGDWTTGRMQTINPYYPLFNDPQIGSQYPTFENGGLQNEIGRLLADEVVQIMPEVGNRANLLIAPLSERLGWEFADAELPVARLWSRFTYDGPDGLGPVEYRVGGVLGFTVGAHVDVQSGDVLYQYPVISNWLGPVLLETAPESSGTR